MAFTNKQHSDRCGKALAAYSKIEPCTTLIDWLTDAMHWCDCNGHDFADMLNLAIIHFEEESAEAANEGSSS